jgi:hypothetical protein
MVLLGPVQQTRVLLLPPSLSLCFDGYYCSPLSVRSWHCASEAPNTGWALPALGAADPATPGALPRGTGREYSYARPNNSKDPFIHHTPPYQTCVRGGHPRMPSAGRRPPCDDLPLLEPENDRPVL